MFLVAQLADAQDYAVGREIGRAHLHQIGNPLAGSAAEERHALQVSRRLLDDEAIAVVRPGLMTAVLDLEPLHTDGRIVVAIAARHAPLQQHPHHPTT